MWTALPIDRLSHYYFALTTSPSSAAAHAVLRRIIPLVSDVLADTAAIVVRITRKVRAGWGGPPSPHPLDLQYCHQPLSLRRRRQHRLRPSTAAFCDIGAVSAHHTRR